MTNIQFPTISRSVGFLLSTFYLLLTTASARAQGLVPCKGTPADPCMVSDFFQLFTNIYNMLLGFAAIVAVLMIVIAGVRMLIYFWSEQPESDLENAKLTLRRAVWGLIIVICAYLVVNTLLTVLGAGDITTFFGVFG